MSTAKFGWAIQLNGCAALIRVRLKLEQDRVEQEREKTEVEVMAQFLRWAKNSKVREIICDKSVSEAEKRAQVLELFGLPPEPSPGAAPNESNENEDDPPVTTSVGDG